MREDKTVQAEERPMGEDGLRLTEDERKFAESSGDVDRISSLPFELLELVCEMVNDEGTLRRLNRACRVLYEVSNPVMWRMPIYRKPFHTGDISRDYYWGDFSKRKGFAHSRHLLVITRTTVKQGLAHGPTYARKIEKSISAAGITHIEAVFVLAIGADRQTKGLSVAFSTRCRFTRQTIVAIDSIAKNPLKIDHLEFLLPDLGTDAAPRVCQLLPIVGKKMLEITPLCQMRLQPVSEEVVEKHLPAAMMVLLGFFATSCQLWDPESQWNPEGWPNVRKFKTTSTQKVERYHPPTVLFDGVTYSKAEVALRAYAHALGNDHRLATVAIELHVSWFIPVLKPDQLKEKLQKLCEPLRGVYPEACRKLGHAVGGVYFLGPGHKRFYLDHKNMEFVPLLEEDVRGPVVDNGVDGQDS